MWAATSLCLLVQNLKQIADCYSPNTVVQYRDNINQLVIKLDSNNNSACEVFPDGVDVNVTLGEINPADPTKFIQPISRTILNFNYKTSKELYLNDIEEIDVYDINMILIEIYSYAEITEIHGCVYQSSVSSLTDCFYPNTSILIRQNDFLLSLHATGLCRQQIDDMTEFKVVINSESLSFDMTNLDLLNLKQHYAIDKPFSIILPGQYMSFWDVSQIQARITLTTNQEIDFWFDFVDVQTIDNLYSVIELMRSDEGFHVYLQPNSAQMQLFKQKISAASFDSVGLRINFNNGYEYSKTVKQFDPDQVLISFSCLELQDSEKTSCLTQYKKIDSQPQLEIVFYSELNAVLVQISDVSVKNYFFESLILQIDKTGLRIKVTYNGSSFTEKVTINLNLTQTVTHQVISFLTQWSRRQNCLQLNTYYSLKQLNGGWIMSYEIEGFKYQTLIHFVDDDDYGRMTAVSVALGVVFVLLCGLFTIIQVMTVQKQIRLMKKKRNTVELFKMME
ncbi:Conserved_hypothetical protein [Hexamita inflata]|uniref:Transmembrane protein n=1 Tax=Hexamita inflata TaxID=28002 RepID=A0AA86NYX1_9EUKA|nr:Conserved hypothetical protein [Hexamita inflata]CAI9954860.1 Conserved hypothetical protein [Hexamita inflata]